MVCWQRSAIITWYKPYCVSPCVESTKWEDSWTKSCWLSFHIYDSQDKAVRWAYSSPEFDIPKCELSCAATIKLLVSPQNFLSRSQAWELEISKIPPFMVILHEVSSRLATYILFTLSWHYTQDICHVPWTLAEVSCMVLHYVLVHLFNHFNEFCRMVQVPYPYVIPEHMCNSMWMRYVFLRR